MLMVSYKTQKFISKLCDISLYCQPAQQLCNSVLLLLYVLKMQIRVR